MPSALCILVSSLLRCSAASAAGAYMCMLRVLHGPSSAVKRRVMGHAHLLDVFIIMHRHDG